MTNGHTPGFKHRIPRMKESSSTPHTPTHIAIDSELSFSYGFGTSSNAPGWVTKSGHT
jgi:hypothetical protein